MRRLKKKRSTKTIMRLRMESRRRRLARMMFLDWSTERCARALHCSPDTVRDIAATPEFQQLLSQYEGDAMAVVDRAMPHLLLASIESLHRNLTSHDWKARDAAIEKIMLPHGRVLERLLSQRSTDPPGTVRMLPPMDDLTDEMREKARELLRMVRHTRPALIDKIQQEPREDDRD